MAALHFTSHSHPSPTFYVALTSQAIQYFPGALSHLTVSGLVLLPQKSRLVFRRGLSRHWKVVKQLLYTLHWNFTLCSSGGFYFTSRIQDKGFGTLYKDIVPLVFLKVVVRQYLGCNLGAHLPLCVARSRLGGALTPP